MSESGEHSITIWIDQLKAGEEDAAQRLWERYWVRLANLCRGKMTGHAQRTSDHEDIAQEAFEALFRAVQQGRFPQLHDRQDLWQLLLCITENKLRDHHKRQRRKKRGAGQVRGNSVFMARNDAPAGDFDLLAGADLTPEFAAIAREECERLLHSLADSSLQRVALLKLQGYSHEEIASDLGCVVDTVVRKLRFIRAKWKDM